MKGYINKQRAIAEQLDDRTADDLLFEATGHTVIVLPYLGDVDCESSILGVYE